MSARISQKPLWAVLATALGLSFACTSSSQTKEESESGAVDQSAIPGSFKARKVDSHPDERHLTNLRMLSDGADNAEAYFAFGGDKLIFQSNRAPYECDQIYTMNLDGSDLRMVSSGKGRTTCSYFLPDDRRFLYASTHEGGDDCPPPPDHSLGYTWPLYSSYDLYVGDGEKLVALTDTEGYDAEATISPLGDRIVFTSMRDGDLDLYTMNIDGSDVVRLTDRLGYDGGAFFSPDGSKIVWRAHYPEEKSEIDDYKNLLAQGLIRPNLLELYVADADGSNVRQITNLKAASFGPFFHPSGEKIIFSTNYPNRGREFDLYMIDLDGSNLERITYTEGFDGFPMFSPDGKMLVFGSNRYNSSPRDTNIFLADWVD